MHGAQQESKRFTEADKLAHLVNLGVELDLLLEEYGYIERASAQAASLASEPDSNTLNDVMITGRAYLSPLTGEHEHYWPSFIAIAKQRVKEYGSDDRKVNWALYDFIGRVMIKLNIDEIDSNQVSTDHTNS
ncbi:hypothetical protein H0V99_03190 [Candidatus Saccharibacteria bacterium]|nr:hypothetical protein [Candidatus Saccharibacteria bacterium]